MVDLAGEMSRRSVPRVASLGLCLFLAAVEVRAASPNEAGEQQNQPATTSEHLPLTVILQDEYIDDSDGDTFHDPSLFVGYHSLHAQLWYGEFTKGIEVGTFLRDRRRSTYGFWYRFRDDFDHVVEANTEQIIGNGFVLFGALRYIRPIPDSAKDKNLLEPIVGFDKYYGNYHFFSCRAIRDPREATEYSFVISNRIAFEDKYVTLGIVPRTDGNTGYFVQAKWRWLRIGYGSFGRFDFTEVDRKTFNVGIEFKR